MKAIDAGKYLSQGVTPMSQGCHISVTYYIIYNIYI